MKKRYRIAIAMSMFVVFFVVCFINYRNAKAGAINYHYESQSVSVKANSSYKTTIDAFTYNEYYIPAYDGDAFEYVNNNDPIFYENERVIWPFEIYSELDELGRCGVAYANVCQELMPTEPRGSLGRVTPSGWIQAKYDKSIISTRDLYNRSHLIGWQLTGENANKKNIITGTRQFNVNAMLPFENIVDNYVDQTNNHVLYRVTPIFENDNLVANGVLIEAESVEKSDNGSNLELCVFCYNVQKGIAIDYSTGKSKLSQNK